jgi:hypothetical protein
MYVAILLAPHSLESVDIARIDVMVICLQKGFSVLTNMSD